MTPPHSPGRRRFLQSAAVATAAAGVGDIATAPTAAAITTPVHPALAPKLDLVTNQSWHLARRAAHAPTPKLVAEITAMGAARWVDLQLDWQKVPDVACQAMLDKHLPWLKLSTAELARVSGDRAWVGSSLMSHATAMRQVFSNRRLYESVVDAMGDQVYVGAAKADQWVMDFDRTVIRRYALSNFSSLLAGAVRHPALLMFLDNDVNTKDSPNENLGRELLELHTVGEGVYTEADVRQSALLLTGHSYDWTTRAYRFRPEQHHVGRVKVLGFTADNANAADGPAVLDAYARYLAWHPATAKRVCRRLAVRFVSDTPSDALVADLAKVYLGSQTRIAPVVKALFAHREFTASVGKKWRRPQEWMAAMTATGQPTWKPTAEADQAGAPWKFYAYPSWLLTLAGHAPRGWHAVNGYPDVADYWTSTAAMLAAWNTAEAVAGRWDTEVVGRPWEAVYSLKVGENIWTAVARMAYAATGYTWRREDLSEIASMLCSNGSVVPKSDYALSADDIRWRLTEAVRLILSSPYFLIR